MAKNYDCIVAGLGGFGSSALYHVARRGVSVLGLERFGLAHDRGSSHGETRIIRQAYFEHPDYVPLCRRAYELWRDLEEETGRQLARWCSVLLAGPAEGETVAGAKAASRLHGVPLQEVSRDEARTRFPGFRFPDDSSLVFEPQAGYLLVEECVRSHIRRAADHGAVLKTGERVVDWDADGRTVRVQTDRAAYEAARLIVTAGPWAAELLSELGLALRVVRKPVLWHRAVPQGVPRDRLPVFYVERPAGAFYGVPGLDGRTVKLAEHTGGREVSDPAQVDRALHPEDLRPVQEFIRKMVLFVEAHPVRHAVCMYTHSPDGHFVVDRHPQHETIAFGAGFSGHGFKFTPVLGAALADLALEGRTEHPITFLRCDRDSLQ